MGFTKMCWFDFSFVYMFTAGFRSCVSVEIRGESFKIAVG